jgi:hypothetical protein
MGALRPETGAIRIEWGAFKMKKMKNRRKAERRKPGDLRFPGRLVGKRAGASRKGTRRKTVRRKG